MLGTVQDLDTAQLPQSTRPELETFWQLGWVDGPVGDRFPAISRAPSPP